MGSEKFCVKYFLQQRLQVNNPTATPL